MRFGQIALELDRTADVIDGAGEQRGVRLVAGARHLVLPETRVGEAHVRQCVARIERDRALEVRDRAGDPRTRRATRAGHALP